MPTRHRTPSIVAIENQNPAWPELDKSYAEEAWELLLTGLKEEGYPFRAFRFFDDLSCLDGLDPHEWLVWNWGEEWAGEAWSEPRVVEEIERRGFAYTGAGPAALRLTQDRMAVKEALWRARLPTPPARLLRTPDEAAGWSLFPAIVKGANQHASVGLDRESVVHHAEQLAHRVKYLRQQLNDDALVELFLDTREFSVAVWGNEAPAALPPSEIVFPPGADLADRIQSQTSKIDRDSRGYQEIAMPCPAPADRPDWRARLETVSVAAYRALGLRDYARFDLRMQGDEPQILDVNTNPELESYSVVLAGAKAQGLTYGKMVSQIIQFAAVRMPRRSSSPQNPDSHESQLAKSSPNAK